MNLNIISRFISGPCGGSHQFLRAIKDWLEKTGHFTSTQNADVYLFNASQSLRRVISAKWNFPDKLFIHRIDGPVRLYNSIHDKRDLVTNGANKYIADATIFQSEWSRKRNYEMGFEPSPFEIVIMNAPDPVIFNRKGRLPFNKNRKIRLIATSWSKNWKKGFSAYEWLDENLDFSSYEMTFIGNSPILFKNIKHIQPLPGERLAWELKKHDVFITASQKDPCSNSLLEALHCGLPVVALNDGGHPEIVGQGGLLFDAPNEIPGLLEKIVFGYEQYQNQINLPEMEEVARRYLEFIGNVYEKVEQGEYRSKRFSARGMIKLLQILFLWKVEPVFSKFKTVL